MKKKKKKGTSIRKGLNGETGPALEERQGVQRQLFGNVVLASEEAESSRRSRQARPLRIVRKFLSRPCRPRCLHFARMATGRRKLRGEAKGAAAVIDARWLASLCVVEACQQIFLGRAASGSAFVGVCNRPHFWHDLSPCVGPCSFVYFVQGPVCDAVTRTIGLSG